MTVTYSEPELVDPQTMRLSFESDKATPVSFRVFREGTLVSTFSSSTDDASYEFQVPPGDHPFVEVLDEDAAIPSIAFPGRMTLNWLAAAGATYYRIDEYVSAVWTERGTVPEDGSGAYAWQTRWLEDVTTHQFRVVPIGADGNAATALSFSAEMVRHPNAPVFSVSYSSGTGNATISVTG